MQCGGSDDSERCVSTKEEEKTSRTCIETRVLLLLLPLVRLYLRQ